MAGSCYGKRLSELLQEQQEPFLLLLPVAGAGLYGEKGDDAGRRRRRRYAMGGALRRALRRWDATGITAVAGCLLPCGGGAAGGVERFRQLRRGVHDDDDCDDEGGGGARRLSPVSVLDVLHAAADDDDSNWEEDDDDDRPSTSPVSSPPSDLDLAMTTTTTTTSGDKSMDEKDEEQRTIISSSWETVAADIARIPLLLELDLSGGQPRDRRRRRLADKEAEEEAWRVVASIEAMIFEEMRGDAVRAMID